MTWKLPTKADWQNMIIGCGGSIDATSGQMDFTDLQEKLYAVTDHALTLQNYYWTADEYDEYNVYNLRFDCMSMTANFSYCMPTNYISFYTHACIDFNVAEPVSIVATTADVGKLLCTDGSIYDSVAAAEADSKTPVGMIAFVDMEQETGLVIALNDDCHIINEGTVYEQTDYMMDKATATTVAGAHTPAINDNLWRLPTIEEWKQMLLGTDPDGTGVNDFTFSSDYLNNNLAAVGGFQLEGYYCHPH